MICSSIWGGILQRERSKSADAGNVCLSATNLIFSPPEASNLQLYSRKAEVFCLAFNLHSTSQRLSRKCSDSLNRHLSPLCECEVVFLHIWAFWQISMRTVTILELKISHFICSVEPQTGNKRFHLQKYTSESLIYTFEKVETFCWLFVRGLRWKTFTHQTCFKLHKKLFLGLLIRHKYFHTECQYHAAKSNPAFFWSR